MKIEITELEKEMLKARTTDLEHFCEKYTEGMNCNKCPVHDLCFDVAGHMEVTEWLISNAKVIKENIK
ncbi:MAG: hypothetical protein M0R51_11700 [Clostridia bacterium]|jgi:hypothetical protein|nr:hypothetical protein [Clostridia bacterium]